MNALVSNGDAPTVSTLPTNHVPYAAVPAVLSYLNQNGRLKCVEALATETQALKRISVKTNTVSIYNKMDLRSLTIRADIHAGIVVPLFVQVMAAGSVNRTVYTNLKTHKLGASMRLPRSKPHRTPNQTTEQHAQILGRYSNGSAWAHISRPRMVQSLEFIAKVADHAYVFFLALPVHLRPADSNHLSWRRYIPYRIPSQSATIQSNDR